MTTCRFATFDDDVPEPFDLDQEEISCRMIIVSSYLKEALKEFDSTVIDFAFQREEPYFSLSSIDLLGSITSEFGKNIDIIETYACTERQKRNYKIPVLNILRHALDTSSKTCVRVNSIGILSLQLMITTDRQPAFVEYLCIPQVEDDS